MVLRNVLWLVIVSMTSLSYGVDTPREQIGEVFGKPVYRDQLKSASESELHRLFSHPLGKRFLNKNKEKLRVTPDEIKAFQKYLDRYGERRKRGLEEKLSDPFLSDEQKRRLNDEIRGVKSYTQGMKKHKAAVWRLSHWKQQRLMYLQYGGGGVIFQQVGLEAIEATHTFLKQHEKRGDFKITDPDLRKTFYKYYTMRHRFISKELLNEEFLYPGWYWLPPVSAPKPAR